MQDGPARVPLPGELELEGRHHAEVSAAAAKRPEQIRIFGGITCREHGPTGSDYLTRPKVVDGRSVFPQQPTHTAAERQTSNTGFRNNAARNRQTEYVRSRSRSPSIAPLCTRTV